MPSKTSIFSRARRKNDGAPDRQEETHKKNSIHFTEFEFYPILPSFPQFSPIFMTSKTSIFLRARRKNNGPPDRQEETHKKYIIHFTEIQFSPVLPSSAQFCPVFPSFIQFSSVLLSFSSNFTQFRPVSPSFAQFCLVFSSFLQLTFTKFSSILLSFRPISSSFNLRLVSPSFIQFCPILSSFRKCRSAILSRSSQIISVFYFYINVFPFILFYILFCSISFFCTILPGSSQEISVFYFYGCSH